MYTEFFSGGGGGGFFFYIQFISFSDVELSCLPVSLHSARIKRKFRFSSIFELYTPLQLLELGGFLKLGGDPSVPPPLYIPA